MDFEISGDVKSLASLQSLDNLKIKARELGDCDIFGELTWFEKFKKLGTV